MHHSTSTRTLVVVLVALYAVSAYAGVADYSVEEVTAFARQAGVADKHIEILTVNEMNGEAMIHATKQDLLAMGLPFGTADKLVREFEAAVAADLSSSGSFAGGSLPDVVDIRTHEDIILSITLPAALADREIYVIDSPVAELKGKLTLNDGSVVTAGAPLAASDGRLLYYPPTNFYGEDNVWLTALSASDYFANCEAVDADGHIDEDAEWLGESCEGVVRLRIIVEPENDVPVAEADAATVLSGHRVSINVLANDVDPDTAMGDNTPACTAFSSPRPTGNRAPPSFHFTDVTKELGLDRVKQMTVKTSPNCLFAQWDKPAKRWDNGSFCLTEQCTGGGAAGDFDGDGYYDLYLAVMDGKDVLWRNNGDGSFTDVTTDAGLDGTADHHSNGVLFVDIDNDGDLDIFVTTVANPRFYLYVNDGMGRFTEDAVARGLGNLKDKDNLLTAGFSITAADYDNDGWIDLYTTEWQPRFKYDIHFEKHTHEHTTCLLLRNLGGEGKPGHFVDATPRSGIYVKRVHSDVKSLEDLKNKLRAIGATEDQIDMETERMMQVNLEYKERVKKPHVAGRVFEAKGGKLPNYFLSTDFDGAFEFSAQFSDLDSDGYLDLMIAGDFGTSQLYWNNGDGTFSRGLIAGSEHSDHSMGSTIADFDLDGRLDVFLSSVHLSAPDLKQLDRFFPGAGLLLTFQGNRLHRNMGDRKFRDVTDTVGVREAGWSWGGVFFDMDNDGDLDLLCANGFDDPETTDDDFAVAQRTVVYRNEFRWDLPRNATTMPRFTDVAETIGLGERREGRAVFELDYDNDGDLDVFFVNHGEAPALYRNDGGNYYDWIRVKALDPSGHESLGAKVFVAPTAADEEFELFQETKSNSGFLSQGEILAHFGLRVGLDTVHRIRVVFTASNNEHIFYGVPIRTTLVVTDSPGIEDSLSVHESAGLTTPPCGKLQIVAASAPLHGNVRVAPSGLHLEYFADPGYVGTDEFSYTVSDGNGGTASASVKVTVTAPPEGADAVDDQSWVRNVATYDGRFNNLERPQAGAIMTPLIRLAPAGYADGYEEPAGPNRKSTRIISNELFAQSEDVFDERGLNDLHAHFGQLLTHDLDFVTPLADFTAGGNLVIEVPKCDSTFDPECTGESVMRFRRSGPKAGTGAEFGSVREQVNKVTAFADLSTIYGTAAGRSGVLRTHNRGRLIVGKGSTLKYNTDHAPNLNLLGHRREDLMLSGDNRANVQPGLLAMHTLFHNHHNKLADEIFAANPTLSDDEIFERARALNRAHFQSIVYNEWLPATLGTDDPLPPYTGYDASVDPSIANEFATAAFRFGHSQVTETMRRLNADGSDWSGGHLQLRDAYFEPGLTTKPEGALDALYRGMVNTNAQAVDTLAMDGVRNFLFGTNTEGFDLIAININRGRDHGLADYNSIRVAVGLDKVTSFDEITSNAEVASKLASLYDSVDDIDALVGMLAEDHRCCGRAGSSVGPTIAAIIRDQLTRVRDGDRFYYEADDLLSWMNASEKKAAKEAISAIRMKDILEANTGITVGSDSAFFVPE